MKDHLPQRMRCGVERRMRAAYHADSAVEAEAQLTALARELDKTHSSAANSLREGMAETLTVLALDVPPTLARTLRSTNAIWVFDWCRQSGFAGQADRRALTLNAIDVRVLDSNCRVRRLGVGPGCLA